MRTKAYFSILFSLNVCEKRFFSGNTDFSLPELPVVPDVGKIRKIRKIGKFRYLSHSLIGMDYCSKFQVKSMISAKVMAKLFWEDLTRNFRKFDGWFQLMASNFGCGHVNSTKIFSNVWKRQILKVTKYEVRSVNRKKVIKNMLVGGIFAPPPSLNRVKPRARFLLVTRGHGFSQISLSMLWEQGLSIGDFLLTSV